MATSNVGLRDIARWTASSNVTVGAFVPSAGAGAGVAGADLAGAASGGGAPAGRDWAFASPPTSNKAVAAIINSLRMGCLRRRSQGSPDLSILRDAVGVALVVPK